MKATPVDRKATMNVRERSGRFGGGGGPAAVARGPVEGSEEWCRLDKLAEMEEMTLGAISYAVRRAALGLRMRGDDAMGAE